MKLLAIDPGTTRTAYVTFDGHTVRSHAILENEEFLFRLGTWIEEKDFNGHTKTVVCEEIESFGMAVGREVFQTVRWTGRYEQRIQPTTMFWLPRRAVKIHLCQSMKAKDPNIRQALIDKFGGSEAIGSKKMPGPLYGLKSDEWAALAVAVTFWETQIVKGEVAPVETMPPPAMAQTSEF